MTKLVSVSTPKELHAALKEANGGETILLEGGNYGSFSLTPKTGYDFSFPENVTIASKDSDNPAIFTRMDVRGAENLTFDGLTFDYTFTKNDILSERPFNFSGCKDLTIRNSTFDGDVADGVSRSADGYGYAFGLSVRDSTNVVIDGNEFFDFYRAIVSSSNTEIAILDNDIHSIRMDGVTVSETQGVLIEGNYIHDFRGSPSSGDHSDMIQFWTAGTKKPSTDITIRGNTLDIGEGTATQSIFMRNEVVDTAKAGKEMFYRDVLIEDNTIVNGHAHGVTVGESVGLTIRNNSVLHADGGVDDRGDPAVEIPRINVASSSTDVVLQRNVTAGISGHATQPTWLVTGNVVVQDQNPLGSNHYSKVFVSSTLPAHEGRHQFIATKGGLIDELDAGSTMTRGGAAGPSMMFHFEKADTATRVFEIDAWLLGDGEVPKGTVYTWSFGDGSSATGAKVSHSFAEGGIYDVSLSIRLPSGKVETKTLAVRVDCPELLSMDADGQFTFYDAGEPILMASAKAASTSAATTGLDLGAKGVAASIARSHVVDAIGTKDMSIAFSLDADKVGSSGELFRLHGSFISTVTSSGELQFRLEQDGGLEVVLTTKGAKLNGGVERDVVVLLGDGRLQIWVDGTIMGEAAAPRPVGGLAASGQNLTFGNPWGKTNFDGDLTAFDLAVGTGDFPAEPTTVVLDPRGSLLVAEEETLVEMTRSGFTAYDDDVAMILAPVTKMTDEGLQLGDKGVTASIARHHLAEVVGSDEMTIAFTLDADKVGTAGELFRMHGSFIASVSKGGELVLQMHREGQSDVKVVTSGAGLNSGGERDVVISLEDGELGVWVDSDLRGSIEVSGVIGGAKGFGSHGLTFGQPWGKANFQGDLKAFEISVGVDEASLGTQMLAQPSPAMAKLLAQAAREEELVDLASTTLAGQERFEFMPSGMDPSTLLAA